LPDDPKLSLDDQGAFNTDYQTFRQGLFGKLLNLPIDPSQDQKTNWMKAWLALENSDPMHHQERSFPVNMANASFPLLQHISTPEQLKYVMKLGARPTPIITIDPQHLFSMIMQQSRQQ